MKIYLILAPDADTSISCPRPLSRRLFNSLHVLREMGQETQTRVTIHERPDEQGGSRPHCETVLIISYPEVTV